MNLGLSEQQQMLKKSARDFLADKCPRELVRSMEKDERGFPIDLWKEMADLGWIGTSIPEEYGGFGGGYLDLVVLLEEMGRALLPGPFFSTVVLGGSTLVQAGTVKQKRDILPKIADGSQVITLAFFEYDGRYGPEAIRLSAKLEDGRYIVNGIKSFVSDAHIADYIICVIRTGLAGVAKEGISLLLVDARSGGISIDMLNTIAGDKQCRIKFDGVQVPQLNLLGDEGQGWVYLRKVLHLATVGKCAEMVGGAQQVLEMTVEYTRERMQFGRPIGTFQAVQHHCANMLLALDSARLLTYQAAWMVDRGLECSQEVSAAKAWVGDACVRIGALGQQIHGAVAFCGEHDLPLYFKRFKAGQLVFGDSEYHREIVAQSLEKGELLIE